MPVSETQAERTAADGLADRIETHLKLRDSSPGFHLSDDDLKLFVKSVRRRAEVLLEKEILEEQNWDMCHTIAEKDRAALTAALSDQAGGWQLVPKEPTPEMVAAWYRHKNGFHFAGDPPPADTSDYGAYRAMIAAAPPPSSTAGEG